MRVAIIGANGFIGQHLTRLCLRLGNSVTAAILPNTKIFGLEGAEIVFAGAQDISRFCQIFRGVQVVINAAGNMLGANPKKYFSANVTLVESISKALEALESPPKLIHLSSVAAMGPTSQDCPLAEDSPCNPVSLYGRTKRQGENVLLQRKGNFPFIILRPSSFYGPGDFSFLGLFKLAKIGRFIRFCTPNKIFQLTYVEDFLRIFQKILVHPFPVSILNVGNPKYSSDTDLCRALEVASANRLSPIFIPNSLARLAGFVCDLGEILSGRTHLMSSGKFEEMAHPIWLQDMSKQESFFSCADYTSLTDGVQKTWRWYSAQKWI